MASGWGCQHLTKKGDNAEWCRLLERTCAPGQGGCVLYGEFLFSNPESTSRRAQKERPPKKRSNNPLGER